jgi:hypothetical protein
VTPLQLTLNRDFHHFFGAPAAPVAVHPPPEVTLQNSSPFPNSRPNFNKTTSRFQPTAVSRKRSIYAFPRVATGALHLLRPLVRAFSFACPDPVTEMSTLESEFSADIGSPVPAPATSRQGRSEMA